MWLSAVKLKKTIVVSNASKRVVSMLLAVAKSQNITEGQFTMSQFIDILRQSIGKFPA